MVPQLSCIKITYLLQLGNHTQILSPSSIVSTVAYQHERPISTIKIRRGIVSQFLGYLKKQFIKFQKACHLETVMRIKNHFICFKLPLVAA